MGFVLLYNNTNMSELVLELMSELVLVSELVGKSNIEMVVRLEAQSRCDIDLIRSVYRVVRKGEKLILSTKVNAAHFNEWHDATCIKTECRIIDARIVSHAAILAIPHEVSKVDVHIHDTVAQGQQTDCPVVKVVA